MAENYDSALQAYREQATTLFGQLDGAALDDAEARGTELLERSQQLENSAAEHLNAGESEVRELAAAQLAAGAALDLAAASDVLRRAGVLEADAGLADESEFERTYSSLSDILEASPALGSRTAFPAPAVSAALEEAPPLEALTTAAKEAIDGISDDAGKICNAAVDGIEDIGGNAILGAFDEAADRLLGPLYEKVKGWVRLAVRYLTKAVSKLLRLLGPLEGPARKFLKEKLSGLSQEKIVGFLLDQALQVSRVREGVAAAIEAIPTDTPEDRLGASTEELGSLATRFGRHRKVIEVIAKILSKLRPFLVTLASWVAAALAAVYGLVLCYGVWVAGDFLDWYRTRDEGRLALVAGVREIVARAGAPA